MELGSDACWLIDAAGINVIFIFMSSSGVAGRRNVEGISSTGHPWGKGMLSLTIKLPFSQLQLSETQKVSPFTVDQRASADSQTRYLWDQKRGWLVLGETAYHYSRGVSGDRIAAGLRSRTCVKAGGGE